MATNTSTSSNKGQVGPVLKYLFQLFLRPTTGWWTSFTNYIRQVLWQRLYQATSRVAANDTQWQYTNYGYVPDDGKLVSIEGEPDDKCGKTCIQLYHEVVNAVPIKGKNVVEVGCGRGGGAYYVAKCLNPSTMTAIDLSIDSIKFAIKYQQPKCSNLHFQQGNALDLPLPDSSYDVVVNVESSHCYPSFPKFLSEVYRILKPGGYFVMCDMRLAQDFERAEQEMLTTGFAIKQNIDITKNVLESMKICSSEKEQLMKKVTERLFVGYIPLFLANFAGLQSSVMFKNFESRAVLYKRFVLEKPE